MFCLKTFVLDQHFSFRHRFDDQNVKMLGETNRAIAAQRTDVYAFAEQMLLNRIFMGEYQEKRYVSKLNTYKDLIVLNRQEKILCDDLATVKSHILTHMPAAWFGYTTPIEVDAPAVYCIWTTLNDTNGMTQAADGSPNDASVGFGEYWFQIKGVHFVANGMEIRTTILRPIEASPAISIGPTISTITQQMLEVDSSKIQQYVQANIVDVNWMQLFQQWQLSANQTAYRFISTEITWNNFVHCIKLFGVLLVAFVKWSCQFVHTLGEFTIRLIVELNKLLKTSTPIILAILNLCSKIVGGLYILLAMIWRDLFGDRDSRNQNNAQRPTAAAGRYRAPPIAYRDYGTNYRPRNNS